MHDKLLMLYMQAYGYGAFENLKSEFVLFRHFSIQALMARMYKLLGCTCITNFNQMGLDPVRVANYFKQKRDHIENQLAGISNAAKKRLLRK